MTYNINKQAIEKWNKENDEDDHFTYEQCVEIIDGQVWNSLDSLKGSIQDVFKRFEENYNWECGVDLDLPEEFFDQSELNDLVLNRYHKEEELDVLKNCIKCVEKIYDEEEK